MEHCDKTSPSNLSAKQKRAQFEHTNPRLKYPLHTDSSTHTQTVLQGYAGLGEFWLFYFVWGFFPLLFFFFK